MARYTVRSKRDDGGSMLFRVATDELAKWSIDGISWNILNKIDGEGGGGGKEYYPGPGISITDNVISLDTTTKLYGGEASLTEDHNAIKNKQDKLAAGQGISITTDNVVSVKLHSGDYDKDNAFVSALEESGALRIHVDCLSIDTNTATMSVKLPLSTSYPERGGIKKWSDETDDLEKIGLGIDIDCDIFGGTASLADHHSALITVKEVINRIEDYTEYEVLPTNTIQCVNDRYHIGNIDCSTIVSGKEVSAMIQNNRGYGYLTTSVFFSAPGETEIVYIKVAKTLNSETGEFDEGSYVKYNIPPGGECEVPIELVDPSPDIFNCTIVKAVCLTQGKEISLRSGASTPITAKAEEHFSLSLLKGKNSSIKIDWGDGQVDNFIAESADVSSTHTSSTAKYAEKLIIGNSKYSYFQETQDDLTGTLYCRHKYTEYNKIFRVKVYGQCFDRLSHYSELVNPSSESSAIITYNIMYRALEADLKIAKNHTNLTNFAFNSDRLFKVEFPSWTIYNQILKFSEAFKNSTNLKKITGLRRIDSLATCSGLFRSCYALAQCDFQLPPIVTLTDYNADAYRGVFYSDTNRPLPLCGDVNDFFPSGGFSCRVVDVTNFFYLIHNKCKYPCLTITDDTATKLSNKLWNDTTRIFRYQTEISGEEGPETVGIFRSMPAAIKSKVPVDWGGTSSQEMPGKTVTTIKEKTIVQKEGNSLYWQGAELRSYLSNNFSVLVGTDNHGWLSEEAATGDCITIGTENTFDGSPNSAIVIGKNNEIVSSRGAIVIGQSNATPFQNSIVIGQNNEGSTTVGSPIHGIIIGNSNTNTADVRLLMGSDNSIDGGIVLGDTNTQEGSYGSFSESIIVGANNQFYNNCADNIVIGSSNKLDNCSGSIILGGNSTITGADKEIYAKGFKIKAEDVFIKINDVETSLAELLSGIAPIIPRIEELLALESRVSDIEKKVTGENWIQP